MPKSEDFSTLAMFRKLDQQIERAQNRLDYLKSLRAAAQGQEGPKPTNIVWIRGEHGSLHAMEVQIESPKIIRET